MGRSSGRKTLSCEVQRAIVQGHSQGLTQLAIANQFSVSRSTVSRVLKRNQLRGGVKIKKSTGRPKKLHD